MKFKTLVLAGLSLFLLSQCAEESISHKNSNSAKLLVIDAGHGGKDLGAHLDGESEKNKTLQWAHSLREMAEKQGYRVILLREGDQYLSLKDRVAQTNNLQADLLVSLHFGPAKGQNWQVNYSEKSKQSKASQELAQALISAAPGKYEANSGNFFVLNEVNCPALMVSAPTVDMDVINSFNTQILAAL